MAVTRLYLIRHGQVDGHEKKRYNGQANIPLTVEGRRQLDRVCEVLSCQALQAIYSSDLDRCVYGADRLAGLVGLEVNCEPLLREMHCGSWQGRIWEELQKEFPEQWQARLRDIVHYRLPGGESFLDAARRARPVIRKLLQRHAGQKVALFGHGGINRIVLLDALGASLDCAFAIDQDYACLNIIDYHADGRCRIRLMNGTCAHEWNF
jgi:alpha-ribazole phosphatase/probable phosphoglycerate mutase